MVNTLLVIYLLGIEWLNLRMEIHEIRRRNLWKIVHGDSYSDQSVKAFSEKTGKTEQRIRHLIARDPNTKAVKNIGTAAAREFERILGLSIGWLDILHGQMGIKEDNSIYNLSSPIINDRKIPLLSWVQAGEWCDSGAQDMVADEWLITPCKMGKEAFALKVRGSSMEPEYYDGEIIYVDPDRVPKHNDDVVVRLIPSSESTFKRLQIDENGAYLIAINKAFPAPIIPLGEEATICGVVVFSGKFRS